MVALFIYLVFLIYACFILCLRYVFVVAMGTLSVAHLYRQITNYGVHAVDFSGLVKTTLIFAEGCANCSCQHKQGDLRVISANNPGDQHLVLVTCPSSSNWFVVNLWDKSLGLFPLNCACSLVYTVHATNQPIEILKTLKKFLQLLQEKNRARQKKANKYLMKTMN